MDSAPYTGDQRLVSNLSTPDGGGGDKEPLFRRESQRVILGQGIGVNLVAEQVV